MNTEQTNSPSHNRYRVRVWFGRHPIADYTAEAQLAHRYAEAMGRRFAGCTVTVEAVSRPAPDGEGPPPEMLWSSTPL
jgi:hypothetical protein